MGRSFRLLDGHVDGDAARAHAVDPPLRRIDLGLAGRSEHHDPGSKVVVARLARELRQELIEVHGAAARAGEIVERRSDQQLPTTRLRVGGHGQRQVDPDGIAAVEPQRGPDHQRVAGMEPDLRPLLERTAVLGDLGARDGVGLELLLDPRREVGAREGDPLEWVEEDHRQIVEQVVNRVESDIKGGRITTTSSPARRYLGSERCRGRWKNTQNNAAQGMALV